MGIGVIFSKMNTAKMDVSKIMDIRLLFKQVLSI